MEASNEISQTANSPPKVSDTNMGPKQRPHEDSELCLQPEYMRRDAKSPRLSNSPRDSDKVGNNMDSHEQTLNISTAGKHNSGGRGGGYSRARGQSQTFYRAPHSHGGRGSPFAHPHQHQQHRGRRVQSLSQVHRRSSGGPAPRPRMPALPSRCYDNNVKAPLRRGHGHNGGQMRHHQQWRSHSDDQRVDIEGDWRRHVHGNNGDNYKQGPALDSDGTSWRSQMQNDGGECHMGSRCYMDEYAGPVQNVQFEKGCISQPDRPTPSSVRNTGAPPPFQWSPPSNNSNQRDVHKDMIVEKNSGRDSIQKPCNQPLVMAEPNFENIKQSNDTNANKPSKCISTSSKPTDVRRTAAYPDGEQNICNSERRQKFNKSSFEAAISLGHNTQCSANEAHTQRNEKPPISTNGQKPMGQQFEPIDQPPATTTSISTQNTRVTSPHPLRAPTCDLSPRMPTCSSISTVSPPAATSDHPGALPPPPPPPGFALRPTAPTFDATKHTTNAKSTDHVSTSESADYQSPPNVCAAVIGPPGSVQQRVPNVSPTTVVASDTRIVEASKMPDSGGIQSGTLNSSAPPGACEISTPSTKLKPDSSNDSSPQFSAKEKQDAEAAQKKRLANSPLYRYVNNPQIARYTKVDDKSPLFRGSIGGNNSGSPLQAPNRRPALLPTPIRCPAPNTMKPHSHQHDNKQYGTAKDEHSDQIGSGQYYKAIQSYYESVPDYSGGHASGDGDVVAEANDRCQDDIAENEVECSVDFSQFNRLSQEDDVASLPWQQHSHGAGHSMKSDYYFGEDAGYNGNQYNRGPSDFYDDQRALIPQQTNRHIRFDDSDSGPKGPPPAFVHTNRTAPNTHSRSNTVHPGHSGPGSQLTSRSEPPKVKILSRQARSDSDIRVVTKEDYCVLARELPKMDEASSHTSNTTERDMSTGENKMSVSDTADPNNNSGKDSRAIVYKENDGDPSSSMSSSPTFPNAQAPSFVPCKTEGNMEETDQVDERRVHIDENASDHSYRHSNTDQAGPSYKQHNNEYHESVNEIRPNVNQANSENDIDQRPDIQQQELKLDPRNSNSVDHILLANRALKKQRKTRLSLDSINRSQPFKDPAFRQEPLSKGAHAEIGGKPFQARYQAPSKIKFRIQMQTNNASKVLNSNALRQQPKRQVSPQMMTSSDLVNNQMSSQSIPLSRSQTPFSYAAIAARASRDSGTVLSTSGERQFVDSQPFSTRFTDATNNRLQSRNSDGQRRRSSHDYFDGLPGETGSDSQKDEDADTPTKETGFGKLSIDNPFSAVRAQMDRQGGASHFDNNSPIGGAGQNCDMSRYMPWLAKNRSGSGGGSGDQKGWRKQERTKRKSRWSTESGTENIKPWPKICYGWDSLSIDHCVIAGDSITRPLKECAATKEIFIVAAPGARAFAPHIEKWQERLWEPLEAKLRTDSSLKLLLLHIGTNDVGTRTEACPYTVFGMLMKLLRKIRDIAPHLRIIISSILPRAPSEFDDNVTEIIPVINNIIYEVNDIIEMKAEKEKYTFLDNHEVFRDNAVAYYKDGLHLSTEGSRLLAEQFRHKIEEELAIIAKQEESIDTKCAAMTALTNPGKPVAAIRPQTIAGIGTSKASSKPATSKDYAAVVVERVVGKTGNGGDTGKWKTKMAPSVAKFGRGGVGLSGDQIGEDVPDIEGNWRARGKGGGVHNDGSGNAPKDET